MAYVPEEFTLQYETELRRWLRRRLVWYAAVMTVFWGGLGAARTVTFARTASLADTAVIASFLNALLKPAVCVGALAYVRRRPAESLSRRRLIAVLTVVVVATGAISALSTPFIASRTATFSITDTDAETAARLRARFDAVVPLVINVMVVLVSHLSASLFIPWSPREAVRPLLWLMGVAGGASLIQSAAPLWIRLSMIGVMPVAGVPGVALSWWRYARFRKRFGQTMVAERYGEMKRELVDARRIHEALFPPPVSRGPVRLAYRYEPMRQIGGDFLYAHPLVPAPAAHGGALSVVLIDVTGHGVPAALTVSGLHGELERLFSESAARTPGEALAALNRYAAAVLARHKVYPSALCLRVDPEAGRLTWASAGHPPAFLRRAGTGAIEVLDSTTFLLGVVDGASFDPEERSVAFGRGDAVVAYTDGASEALDASGAMLRPEGVRAVVAGAPADEEGSLASAVVAAVARHRHDPPTDDTLIIELRRAE